MQYTISSPSAMIELGQSLPQIGHKFLVHGILGAGKTHLCKGFATALGLDSSQVHSPTYVYYHEYTNRGQNTSNSQSNQTQFIDGKMEQQKNNQNPSFNESKLFHGDFYRIDDPSTLTLRGINDTMEDYDYCFIEWPNFAQYYADPSRHTITIKHDPVDENSRVVIITPYSK